MVDGRQYWMEQPTKALRPKPARPVVKKPSLDEVVEALAVEEFRNPEVTGRGGDRGRGLEIKQKSVGSPGLSRYDAQLTPVKKDNRFVKNLKDAAKVPGAVDDAFQAVVDYQFPDMFTSPTHPDVPVGQALTSLKNLFLPMQLGDVGVDGGLGMIPIVMPSTFRGPIGNALSKLSGGKKRPNIPIKKEPKQIPTLKTARTDLTEVEFKKMQNIDMELLEEDLNFERIAELVGWKGKVNTATHPNILKIANKKLDELMEIRRKFVDKTKDPRNPLDLELPDDSSLDFTGVKGAKAQGQCYPYCYRKAFEKDETIKIVHGQVDNGLGELTPHAWIETKDGLVLDWQTMEGPKEILEQLSSTGSPVITSRLKHYGKGIPVKEFNKSFKPVRDLEFTPEEMRKLTSGTRSSGPFTVEEIDRVLGNTPKTKRKPFDEYTRDRGPESYINPGDTELQKEFAEIASAQRGAPEKIMLKITNTDKGMEREYTFISEHIGDLYNRMTQPGNMAQNFDVITDKFKKLKLNLSPKSNATLPRYVKLIKEKMPEMVELLDEFADAHAAVDISTSMGVAKPVQLARDAAVAYGKLDLDEAVRLLKELEPYMENYDLFKKAMFNFGR